MFLLCAGTDRAGLGLAQRFGSICCSRRASADETSAGWRSRRFRFDDFLVRMCCLFALRRTSLPVPVFLKRFAAPRCDFIFGISIRLPARRSARRRPRPPPRRLLPAGPCAGPSFRARVLFGWGGGLL